MRLPKLAVTFAPLCLLLAFHGAGSAQVRVAAAADLQPVMPALAQAFEKETGIKLDVSIGSSGTLATQILNGAPFDLFLGADYSFPEQVVAAGKADEHDPVAYAKGTLVLWERNDSPIKPLSIDLLTDARVKTIAIANDEHAPYGRAAVAALQRLKVYDAVKRKLVVADNIAQTAQFIESGNAQMGFISLTLASSPHFKELGTYVLVPFAAYPEIRQCGVVIKGSAHNAEAHKFLEWLTSDKVQMRLNEFGLARVR
jgi:molybdate transport system substrate-binding protein